MNVRQPRGKRGIIRSPECLRYIVGVLVTSFLSTRHAFDVKQITIYRLMEGVRADVLPVHANRDICPD